MLHIYMYRLRTYSHSFCVKHSAGSRGSEQCAKPCRHKSANSPNAGIAVGGDKGGTQAVGMRQCSMTAIPASLLICKHDKTFMRRCGDKQQLLQKSKVVLHHIVVI